MSDPSNSSLARRIVGFITAKDRIHDQAVDSFAAAYSLQEIRRACAEVIAGNPGLQAALIDTGFMFITHLAR